jgi:hypothetical protein
VERADKITTPGMITSQIINRLHDVELVIADLTFHNANAFYETSIRHKVAKPIIHMIRQESETASIGVAQASCAIAARTRARSTTCAMRTSTVATSDAEARMSNETARPSAVVETESRMPVQNVLSAGL